MRKIQVLVLTGTCQLLLLLLCRGNPFDNHHVHHDVLLEQGQQQVLQVVEMIVRDMLVSSPKHDNLSRLLDSHNNDTDDSDMVRLLNDTDTDNFNASLSTLAPSMTTPPSPWTCVLAESGYHICYGPRPSYLKEAPTTIVLFHVCSVDLSLQTTFNDDDDDDDDHRRLIQSYCTETTPFSLPYGFCLLQDTETKDMCAGCNILPDGSLVFNCDALFAAVTNSTAAISNTTTTTPTPSLCYNRNDLGKCNRNHTITWSCFRLTAIEATWGTRFTCVPYDHFGNRQPASAATFVPQLSSNVSNGLQTNLFCQQPIYGWHTLNQCASDICTLFQPATTTSPLLLCEICRILDIANMDQQDTGVVTARESNIFAYDCADAYPTAVCASTDTHGKCIDGLDRDALSAAEGCHYPLNRDDQDASSSEQASSTHGIWAKSWVLQEIEPRTFNIVSDLIALVTRSFAGLCIALAYPALLSWYLQRPKSPGIIPSALDASKGNLLATANLVWLSRGAIPILALFLALGSAEMSHPLADVGFDFVQVPEKGIPSPVMSLDTQHRNPHRPLETMGDPDPGFIVRREITKAVSDGDRSPILPVTTYSEEVDAYKAAVLSVARGSSPFVSSFGGTLIPRVKFGPLANMTTRVGIPCNADPEEPSRPLTWIPMEIPVSCGEPGTLFNSSMVQIPQIITGYTLYEDPLRHVASVPNCTLWVNRTTGIFADSSKKVQTLERAHIFFTDGDNDEQGSFPISLIVNGTVSKTFQVTPQDKKLARYRPNWKQGRLVQGIQGVQVNNATFGFSTVILASGPGGVSDTETRYRFFARFNDTCPERPSGYDDSTSDIACFAMMDMDCETFQEDSQISQFLPSDLSTCQFKGFVVIWGKNFVMDDELLATFAGVYGVLRPSLISPDYVGFYSYGILAAVFALGSLIERPSIEIVVRPRISVLYIIAMIIPLITCVICLVFFLSLHSQQLTLPSTAYELMVFGHESLKVPKRRSKRDKFPEPSRQLRVMCIPNASENGAKTLTLVDGTTDGLAAAMLAGANNIIESPVDLSSEELCEKKGDNGATNSDALNQVHDVLSETENHNHESCPMPLTETDEEIGSSPTYKGS